MNAMHGMRETKTTQKVRENKEFALLGSSAITSDQGTLFFISLIEVLIVNDHIGALSHLQRLKY